MLGINKLLAFLRRQVGLRTDPASATGSLHGKLKDIADNKLQTAIGTSAHTRANNTVMGWLASPVKSVQRGVASMASGSGGDTLNVTIAAVTMSKAVVIVSGFRFASTDSVALTKQEYSSTTFTVSLANATTLDFIRGTILGQVLPISWQVIEFY